MARPEAVVMTTERKLPYHTHPLFYQRKLLVITALIGTALCVLTINTNEGMVFTVSLLFLVLSMFLAACDLNCYAMRKVHQPDEDPPWPRVITMVADFVLAVVLQLLFWASVGAAESLWYGSRVCAAYAALTDLICSLIHAYCFWKQVEARCKKKWLASLAQESCKRCGHKPAEDGPANTEQERRPTPPFSAGACHAVLRESSLGIASSSQDSRMEEGLLIDSDLGSGYGAVDPPESALEQPEVVIAGKSKKKQRRG